MIKWPITYVDFDGNEQTEEHRCALNRSELIEMNFSASGGMEKMLQRIIDTKDTKEMIKIFKELILKSYGELSDDGRRFVKQRDGHSLADDFAQTAAFDELFMQLASDDEKAAEFVNGIIPKDLAKQVEAQNIKGLPTPKA
jgi:hypothetical protein